MKWVTTQQLDLKPVRAGSAGIQPHCGAFHHSQALFAVAVGRNIVGKQKLLLFSFFFFSFLLGMYVYFRFFVCLGCGGEFLLMGIKGSELAAWKKEAKPYSICYRCGESFCSLLSCLAKC